MNTSANPNSMPKIWFGYTFAALVLAIGGCNAELPPPTQAGSATRAKAENAPPLKIIMVEAEALHSELPLRWQAFSDQGLQIEVMTRDELSSKDVTTVDVLIYPGNLMGTLVAGEWLAAVPSQAQQQLADWNTWPARWRSLSMYGAKPMAIPLGAPSWVGITRSLDVSPLRMLHERISSNQLSAEVSAGLWEDFLAKAETAVPASVSEREGELKRLIDQMSPESRRHLVSRYLWLLSSTESRYRGLFDMYKLLSRLNQPEFVRAAIQLRRLAVLEPSTIFSSPTQAWEAVAEGKAVFGLGWPRTDNEQRLVALDSKQNWELLPIVWNDASGLMASLGRRTRQSANATEFLVWLADEEQRKAFQPQSAAIEILDIDQDPNRVREDYRDYQTLQRLESGNLSMELTPRFLHVDRFLSLLEEALVDILRAPETAESRMAQCRQECDALVEKVGRESLRSSLEAAVGYTK